MVDKVKKLEEKVMSDGQGEIPEPIGKDTSRPADKHDGETAIPTFKTKVEAMGAVQDALAGLSKEQIGDIFKGLTDKDFGHDAGKAKATRRIGGTAKDDAGGETLASTKRSPTSADFSEDVHELFAGDELNEDQKLRATTIFEAAVNNRVGLEVARLEEDFDAKLEEQFGEVVATLTEKVDTFLGAAIDRWLEENKVAAQAGLKSEVVEEFLAGLRNLFVESYIDVPEDKVDVVEELAAQLAETEERLNKALAKNIEVQNYAESLEVERVFEEATKGLAMTQVEKLRTLAENVEYSDVEEFTKKLGVLKETYIDAKKAKPATTQLASLTEAVNFEEEGAEQLQEATGSMAHYVKAISRTSKK
jgi:hypothetical protein